MKSTFISNTYMYDRLYDRLILLGNTRIPKVVLDPLNIDINKKHKS